MRKLALTLVAAVLSAPMAASATTYTYDLRTDQEYGPISGVLTLTDNSFGLVTGGSAALIGDGLTGTVDFHVVTSLLYCGDSCYGWRSGDGTDFYGFDNSYSGARLNDVVLASSATWGTGYTLGIYYEGSGRYQNGLFGPGPEPNFYDYDVNANLVLPAVPEPATWALMLLGFAGLGLAGLARRRSSRRDGHAPDLDLMKQIVHSMSQNS